MAAPKYEGTKRVLIDVARATQGVLILCRIVKKEGR